MTAIEKIMEMNRQMKGLKAEIIIELDDKISKANSLITKEMVDEICTILEEDMGGGYLPVEYGYLTEDNGYSDYYTIGYSLYYDESGRIDVYSGVTSEFEPESSSIAVVVHTANTGEIEYMYKMLDKLIERLEKGELVYEI